MIMNYSGQGRELEQLMEIWLNTNIAAHSFIPKSYWQGNYDFVKEALPTADLYLFKENSTIKGFVGVAESSYLAGIFVLQEFQGEGIGSKLLEHCKTLYPSLSLHVYEKNKGAVSFYQKHGFSIQKITQEDDTGETEYEMQWEA